MPVTLTPILSPSASDVLSTDRLDILVPQLSRMYDETLHQKMQAVRVRQHVAATIHYRMYNQSGIPISLTEYGLTSGSSSSQSASQSDASLATLRARFREASAYDRQTYDADISVYDADNGIVRVAVPSEVHGYPAVYWMAVGALASEEHLLAIFPCYLFVEYSSWAPDCGEHGPPLVDEIRLSIRDSDIRENLLIDWHDFDLAEICSAVVRCIQAWHDSMPPINTGYTTKNFPYLDLWKRGIQLYLFQIAEEHYRRNKLEFSAGGTSSNDKNRDREYKAAWQERFVDFTKEIRNRKAAINVNRGWMTIRQW